MMHLQIIQLRHHDALTIFILMLLKGLNASITQTKLMNSSDSDWDLLPPIAPKRRRISRKASVIPVPHVPQPLDKKQQLWDEKLDKCPAMLKDILSKIQIIDSKTDMFEHVSGDFVEMFSGGAKGQAVSKWFRRRGRPGIDFDLTVSRHHDFCQPYGFCLALIAVFSLSALDPCWTGLVCTSFTWVNLATSQRCSQNHYIGNGLKHEGRQHDLVPELADLDHASIFWWHNFA